ncbi:MULTISPECIES: hypothetical protein [Chryseobacterium]|uniref:hypothetical protein n=1 Tax=Chryseobacterium TaxID=59732 RepID=UPI0019568B9A|nr:MULTISPECIES: hypothetical protein [Chryseobacterium]MBM7421422.1 hypothetical protein [Chryseobacterium sp. JUb44]MDH6211385.1 hypothetical protein [Chryseobacterium sp. BIGb0186]WSO10038.1 hypothetical protein VUJ64_19670 [Chryseobacterium scophthalmum]
MEIKIRLDEYADIPFIKKLLSQIKGINHIEISEDEKTYSWEEIENSENFGKVMEQSENDYRNGNHQGLTDDFFLEKEEIVIDQLLKESLHQAKEGKVKELTDELLSQYFKK